MRPRLPWCELSVLVALYAAFAARSSSATSIGGSSLIVLLAWATALVPRALVRRARESTFAGESSLIAAALACCAGGARTTGIPIDGTWLAMLFIAATALSTGVAVFVACLLGDDRTGRLLRAIGLGAVAVAAVLVAATSPYARGYRWLVPAVGPALLAVVLAVRRRSVPDPESRARLLVPLTGASLALLLTLSGPLLLPHRPIAGAALATGGALLAMTALTIGALGLWLAHASSWSRHAVSAAIGAAAGVAIARNFGDAPLAGITGAVLAAVVVPLAAAGPLQGDRGRLLAAIETARAAAVGCMRTEDLARAVLEPLRAAARDLRAPAEFWVLDGDARYTLDVSGAAYASHFAPGVERALLSWLRAHPGDVVFDDMVRPLEIRRPELRPLIALLEEHQTFAVVPLVEDGSLVGAVLIPRGRRRARPDYREQWALRALARTVTDALSVTRALDRARTRAEEATVAREAAERARVEAEDDRDRTRARTGGGRLIRAVGSLEYTWIGYGASTRAFDVALRKLAAGTEPVTLVAEPGCAVAAVARSLHESSPRSLEPCVLLDAAAVHPRDAVATLVGSMETDDADDPSHRMPAQPGWFELVGAGTLVILEAPALTYDAQVALLDAMNAGESQRLGGGPRYPMRARIVVTTRARGFGPSTPTELRDRLAANAVRVPPLRERPEDLETLVLLAIDRSCRVLSRAPVGIRRDALDALRAHGWPGNEEELFAVVESAAQRARGQQITLGDLPFQLRTPGRESIPPRASNPPSDARDADGEGYDALERRILESALDRSGGNKSEAARVLGLARTTFLDKLRKYGLRA